MNENDEAIRMEDEDRCVAVLLLGSENIEVCALQAIVRMLGTPNSGDRYYTSPLFLRVYRYANVNSCNVSEEDCPLSNHQGC